MDLTSAEMLLILCACKEAIVRAIKLDNNTF